MKNTIGILAVGRLKAGPERLLYERYVERFTAISPSLGIRFLPLRELPESKQRRLEDRQKEESRAILGALLPGAERILLDSRGTLLSTEQFSQFLSYARTPSASGLLLIIGGPDGCEASMREKMNHVLAFGRCTWPHQLIRVMVAEQLYRAATLLTHHPYHRASY